MIFVCDTICHVFSLLHDTIDQATVFLLSPQMLPSAYIGKGDTYFYKKAM